MVWCLDFHAPYRCRHAGACCHAGWTIPFEDGTVAARADTGACTFLDGATRLCSIHRAHGVHALPVTCRMFPRIVLHDARGTFVSLSHFCPTAARLLFDAPGDGTIVPAPAALANIGELDGLDARGEWPPLLRARVMMDPDSFAAWERRSVSLLTRATISADTALAELQDVTARICKWAPGGAQLLQDVVHTAFDRHDDDSAHGTVMPVEEIALKRWLAARLFGAWTTYQGDGLATTLRYLRACLDTFRRERDVDGDALEAVRRSDLDMLHSDRSLKR